MNAFEAGQIDGSDFPHERHVRVAWGLCQRYGWEEGLRRVTAGIRSMADRAGRPQVYHETITRAWYELIAQADDLASAPELFDKRLLGRYYSSARLAAGRGQWLEPDLQTLRLCVSDGSELTLARAPLPPAGAGRGHPRPSIPQ